MSLTDQKKSTVISTKRQKIVEASLIFSCLIAAAIFVVRRGQDTNWDLLNYHYYQGYSLINGRFSNDLAAANLQSFFNPIANALAYLALKHLSFPFSAWSILLIQLISIPAIALLAKEIAKSLGYSRSSPSTIPAVLLSLLAPLWISELGTTFFSSWTLPLLLWGIYLLLTAHKKDLISRNRILIAGILFGLAVGLKLTNAPFALSAIFIFAILNYQNGWRTFTLNCTFFLLTCGIGFSIVGWWYWILWNDWQSPVFPLYNAIFKSEFYDFVNFRDMRWHFSSIQEIFFFITQSAWGTNKTSEIYFADARYLFAALLLPAAIICKPAIRLNKQLTAFLLFMALSFLLWSLMFSYQRYLMPFEVLLGLLIWILVARIVDNNLLRWTIMLSLTICSALTMKVPDWGHIPVIKASENPFDIEIAEQLHADPAHYLVIGAPISYLLPSLHPESIFYGIGFSRQMDDLIFKRLSTPSNLPIRILTSNHDAASISGSLRRLNYSPLEDSLECRSFKTAIDRYTICEVRFGKQFSYESENAVASVSFSKNEYWKTEGILWDRGLSSLEAWGLWSDGDQVEFGFPNCLPPGGYKILTTAHAFGPNVALPVIFNLDNQEIPQKFSSTDSLQIAHFENNSVCLDKLSIHIPKPTSPLELGLSADPRKLGIGIVNLKIVKE